MQPTTPRAPALLDERSPLLPRVPQEASPLPPISPRRSQNSLSTKSTSTGQSTFRQTVCHSVFFFLFSFPNS
jgi:hypothetical protein